MNHETKVKALIAVSEAATKVSKAINEGRFSRIEFILNNLKQELHSIRMSESPFPEGGVHSTATELVLDRNEVNEFIFSKANGIMEEVLNKYQKGESEEDFEKRVKQTRLTEQFYEVEKAFNAIKEQLKEEE